VSVPTDVSQPAGLLGRDEELRAVRTALDGRGCVIAGPAGVGKSRLAADAASQLGSDRTLIRVVATAAAGTIPFGAVSHLLPGGGTPTIADVIAALRDGDLGPAPTLLVDDAQLLDDASAALVLAIATTGVAPLLLTVRSHEPAPDAIIRLWRDRHLDRVDLQPLSAQEVELLIDELLGAPSHAQAYDWVHRLAGGNPLFVTELVTEARRSGRLELREARWHLTDVGAPLERLHDLLGAHIGSLTDPARTALELLAVGAPMPLALVEDLLPGPGLEELERSRLAVVTDDPHQGPLVDVAHPLYGELVRDGLPETAARRIRRELAGALARHGTDGPVERLRIARLLLESGQVDEERFLEASSIALHRGAPDLARRFAEALPPSLPAALGVASGLFGAGRFAEMDAVLAPFEEAAAAADATLAGAYVEARVKGMLRGPGDQPDRAQELITRAERWHDGADWRALIATGRCWTAVFDRAYATAYALVEPSLADPSVGPERRLKLLLAYALALTRLARVDDYRALMVQVGQLTSELGAPGFENVMQTVRMDGSLCAAGRDLAGVRRRTLDGLERAQQRGEPLEHIGLLYVLAHIEHVQGHHADARVVFQRAIDLLKDADAWNLRPMAHVMLSITLSYLGEEGLARRALAYSERAAAEMPGVSHWLAPDMGRARAMLEMAAGHESAAREQLLENAATCGDDVIIASEALHLALLLGADADGCAAGLETLARNAQDDSIHLWTRHARAVADKDPSAQLAAAEAFEAAGLDLDAAQAASLAAAAFQAGGSKDGASRASTLAARCADRCPGVQVPALAARLEAPELTPREREIAVLAARGESNPAIAKALTLSVRTVETYVLRVYRKLGVNNRSGLARVLGTRADPSD
jgi:DNA-binding NarL/FixJ family response regulator